LNFEAKNKSWLDHFLGDDREEREWRLWELLRKREGGKWSGVKSNGKFPEITRGNIGFVDKKILCFLGGE
jgi:hypothetical protein